MKRDESPIPLRSVVCLPRWLFVGGVVLSSACLLAGVGLVVYAIGWADGGAAVGGALGGATGCLIGGAGALWGTLADWRRRLPATAYLRQLQADAPLRVYRIGFWPAVAAVVVGGALALAGTDHAVWRSLVQTGAVLAFVSGTLEATRRHAVRQARIVFALYADGALDAEDTAAIDDARAKDPAFDARVRAWIEIDRRLRAFTADGATS